MTDSSANTSQNRPPRLVSDFVDQKRILAAVVSGWGVASWRQREDGSWMRPYFPNQQVVDCYKSGANQALMKAFREKHSPKDWNSPSTGSVKRYVNAHDVVLAY